MNWDKEIELATEGAAKVTISLDILEEVLLEQLTREEMEILAGELIKFAEVFPSPCFYE